MIDPIFWPILVIMMLILSLPVTYINGKRSGFKLGRGEPMEIQVLKEVPVYKEITVTKEVPVEKIVYQDREVFVPIDIEKVVYQDREVVVVKEVEVPMTPKVCQCGHGICFHKRVVCPADKSTSSYVSMEKCCMEDNKSVCRCDHYVEV
jgi:hypothetical protein